MSGMQGLGRIYGPGYQRPPRYQLLADPSTARKLLRAHVAQIARFPTRMARVAIVAGRGTVPYSELAMHCRCAGKEIFAAAIAYANDDLVSARLAASYAYVLTADGEISEGLPSEVASSACLAAAGESVRRHDPFEWLDGRWYITQTGWTQTPPGYRDLSGDTQRCLVDAGGRGTCLVPVTIIDDGQQPPHIALPSHPH